MSADEGVRSVAPGKAKLDQVGLVGLGQLGEEALRYDWFHGMKLRGLCNICRRRVVLREPR